MNKFAQVKNGVVVAIYEKPAGYDSYFDQKNVVMIDVTDLKITPQKNWNYDSASGTFSGQTPEQKMRKVREERNKRLVQSDKYMLSDIYKKMPAKMQAQWELYRKQLREIPQKFDPDHVIWPVPPSE
jgi:hypothetical protein